MVAEENPQLLSELQEVEEEYQGGYLTELGYKKRRTVLLSKYGLSEDWSRQLSQIQTPTQQPLSNLPPPTTTAPFVPATTPYEQPAFPEAEPPAPLFHAPMPANLSTESPYESHTTTLTSRTTAPTLQTGATPTMMSQRSLQERELALPGAGPTPTPSLDRRASMYDDLSMQQSLADPTAAAYDDPRAGSITSTLAPTNYAFNPNDSMDYGAESMRRNSMMLDSHQDYFSDFAGQQSLEPKDSLNAGTMRYSYDHLQGPAPPPVVDSQLGTAVNHLMPLEPRGIPYDIKDPHDMQQLLTNFDNLPTILRYRSKRHPKQTAFWVLDQKGKETASISWEKLGSRAEKVAAVIRDKSNLYRGGRVALLYRESEIIEFAVALLGCFIAGVVAVPINQLEDFNSLHMILTSTQAHLALTTESNLKMFHRDLAVNKKSWPRGVEWWKTNEFGSYHPKNNDNVPALVMPDLAYIEFSRSPTGELRGVVMSHRTIMHQMGVVAANVTSAPSNPRIKYETVLSYIDPRQSIGLILGVLFPIFHGSTVVFFEPNVVETPGLYAHLISKYRATIIAADYPGLKRVVYNYQQDPMTTRNYKKNAEPSFAYVKWCFIDTLVIDPEFQELLADRWFRPLRNPRSREAVAPMLCLPEHGGMMIATKDFLGGEERLGCPLTHPMNPEPGDPDPEPDEEDQKGKDFGSSLIGGHAVVKKKKRTKEDIWEVLLDREALKSNEVVILAMGAQVKKVAASTPHAVRVGAFGYPIPDATLAIVDPENGVLCTPNVIGEIWVDSPSLSGGFWALPKHTESIFHARPYKYQEGSPTPVSIEPEFLRTGLLGTIIEGKVYILGMYEDRLRQKVEWTEGGAAPAEHRYFFVQHLVLSIMKNVPKIYDCSAFDTYVNEEHLPVIVLESWAASTAPLTSGGPPQQLNMVLLDTLAERCMELLYNEHHLRVYCVMLTAPNTLPRVPKNGRMEIGNMLCRKGFELGLLPCVHIRFGIEKSVMNIPFGVDPQNGIWSPIASDQRVRSLNTRDKQYSGVDMREVVTDDRTSTPLNNFPSITDLLQWRVSTQGEELALCYIDGRGKEGKGITWKKFDTKVAAVAMHLKNKAKLKPGDHVVLMYTHSEDYVYAVHACLAYGLIAMPMGPIDTNRLNEDTPSLLHLISDFGVKAILVNHDVHDLLKSKVVSSHMKQSAHVLKINIPTIYNTGKAAKQANGTRHLGFTVQKAWLEGETPAFVWTYWTPDQRRLSISIGHDTIMGMCKVQKETCQMTSTRPVLGCVRSFLGIGFLHTCLLGPYIGAPTYLVSPLDFATNPVSLFHALARYKVKDTYATTQMLDHAMGKIPGKGFRLQELKNMMIVYQDRPRRDIYQKVRLHFAATGLDRSAINSTYAHILNPMIATRSYMCIEPIELWLDPYHLRRGIVYPVDHDFPNALLLQDSGMVPVSTQLAIVNPESRRLSRVGEFGEIWVQSEANAKAFYGIRHDFDLQRFRGHTVDGDPTATYLRTGDLGFLHTVTRPIGPGGQPVEMQVLFVLGGIGETFEVNGLHHFPVDIEATIQTCHRNITPGGSAVFQAAGLTVAVVEVKRKAYLASMVPVILNAVLNEHQIVCDIISFVGRGDFPRSRLGEKQRGKVLASWITRKLRSIAQFSIRDPEIEHAYPAPYERTASLKPSSAGGAGPADSGSMTGKRAPAMTEVAVSPVVPTPTSMYEQPPMYPAPLAPLHTPAQAPPPLISQPELAPTPLMPADTTTPSPVSSSQQSSSSAAATLGRRFSFQQDADEFNPYAGAGAALASAPSYEPPPPPSAHANVDVGLSDPGLYFNDATYPYSSGGEVPSAPAYEPPPPPTAQSQGAAQAQMEPGYGYNYNDSAYSFTSSTGGYDAAAAAQYGAYGYEDEYDDVTPIEEGTRRLAIVNASPDSDEEGEGEGGTTAAQQHGRVPGVNGEGSLGL